MMSSQELNQDIIFEILSRSTHKTTSRCRILCKDLEDLVHESHFKRLHSQKTDTVEGIFLQSTRISNNISSFVSTGTKKDENANLSLDFLPYDNLRIESCDSNTGIMLCTKSLPPSRGETLYIVCKPSTKQWRCIPRPKTRYCTEAIGISVLGIKPLRFKIVRVSSGELREGCVLDWYYCFRYEVFDSNVWSWRILDTTCFPDRRHKFLTRSPAVSSSGRLNWLTEDGYVLSFCVNTDSIGMFPKPEEVPNRKNGFGTNVKLVKYKGKLGLIHSSDDCWFIDLWVLEDYNNSNWVLKNKIDVRFANAVWPMAFCGSDVAAFLDWYKMILYDFEKDSVDSVEIREWVIEDMFEFCSDMEEIDFRRHQGRSNTKRAIRSFKD